MPSAAPRPCTYPRCAAYATKGGRCDKHKPKAWDHNGKTASQRGYGKQWRATRAVIMRRDLGLCQVCKKKGMITKATEVDHILHKAAGGDDSDANLQAICHTCHRAKTRMESQGGGVG